MKKVVIKISYKNDKESWNNLSSELISFLVDNIVFKEAVHKE